MSFILARQDWLRKIPYMESGTWYSRNKDRAKAVQASRRAGHLNEIRAAGKLYHALNREAINAKKRLQYASKREAIKVKHEAYRKANAERIRAAAKIYKILNRDKVLAEHKAYYAKIKKRQAAYYRARYDQDREKILERSRLHYEAKPEMYRARSAAYRAKRANAAVGTDRKAYHALIRSIRNASRIACHWCGRNVPKGKRHIDHIVPISKGGPDDIANLCCACAKCNLSKAAKMPEQFSPQYRLAFA